MKNNRQGMTLIEIILAITILSIVSISMISGFSSQFLNINRGTDITIAAMEAQSEFEDLLYDVRSKIQEHDPLDSWEDMVATVPEWSEESIEILGTSFEMQKITKEYSEGNKDNSIYLSSKLAEVENRSKLPISGVRIGVSTDVNGLLADLSLSPLPVLTAEHDDNTGYSGFYVNLYRWWKSVPGKDFASLRFPEDFSMINVSQTTDELTNLLDNAGAGRYVALTVTPVDIHGYRGETAISSNYVFVKGTEWRIGAFPWADTNNNYNLESSDVRISADRVQESLNASSQQIPNFMDPSEMLSVDNSSLFVPMNTEPGGGQTPGEIPIQINGSEEINWSFENNINLAKDILSTNGSDINIVAGTGGAGGSIYLYPYIELDLLGNPVTVNGVPNLIDYGASIVANGDIFMKTMSRGDIELFNNNQLDGDSINLEARGSIIINNSTLSADDDIVFDTVKNPEITGNRSVSLSSVILSASNPDSRVYFNTKDDITIKGGGWSSNQTLDIPDGKIVLFSKSDYKISNYGNIDLNNYGRVFFQNSMAEDLLNAFRIRLEKDSNDSFELTTINYSRNLNFASTSNNQKVVLSGLWNKLGSGNHNYEFSTIVLDGPGNVSDLSYSYEGDGIIRIHVDTTSEVSSTRVRFDVRDRYNNEIIGIGYFVYSVDESGNPTIVVEEPPPLNYYTITFNTNGGTLIAPVSGYAGETIGVITNPTRTGYTFEGWDKTIPTIIPEYDLEINAIWRVNEYRISFDSNGGPNIPDLVYEYGEQISIPNPTRFGYTFQGWNETPPQFMPAEDLNFIAQWTQKLLTITFDSNGGTSVDPPSIQVAFDSEYGPLPTPLRTDHTFIGWFTGRTTGSLVTGSTFVSIEDNHTLYARWQDSVIPVDSVQLLDSDGVYKTTIRREIRRNNLPGSIQLNALVLPENATNKTLTWTSSNTNRAVVNSNGLVTFPNNNSTGEVTITVRSENGRTASFILNITSSSGC